MIRTEEEHLIHYGILRRSGRYPWGSGSTQNVRNKTFLDIVKAQKDEGLTETQIAKFHGITTTELRAAKTIANAHQRQQKIITAQRMKDRGWSNSAIGRRMGINESSVRELLKPGAEDKAKQVFTISDMLKEQVAQKGMIDVGKGVEHHIGVTKERLKAATAQLKEEGYVVGTIYVQQVTNSKKYTIMNVLAPPGTKPADISRNRANIKQITDFSDDNGRSFIGTQKPLAISSKRLDVNYAEDGGAKLDGVIYVRPGVKDLSIGASRYGQVRVSIDGKHFLKGMAIYNDNLPEGKDLVFNTNKTRAEGWKTDKNKISDDPDNPFGAVIRQITDPKTGKVSSAMNLVGSPSKEGSGEAGQWDGWSNTLSSQMLSKQSPKLIKEQLNLTYERRQNELKEIQSLTNPIVRRELLIKFGDQTDSAAVHLSAANLPRQATKVLLPLTSIKPTEIYAPTFKHGEKVVLIRHPHAGTFEIPELTVNNRNPEGRRIIGTGADNPRHDAVGIHHKVAQHLSGADFDGDTVLVIPNHKGSVRHTPALDGLKDFDPMQYKIPEGSPVQVIGKTRKQHEMGNISNLITDMTIGGASTEELARAVRHSMVVIDSEKHKLDFKLSEKQNGIQALKEEYQKGKRAGAYTLISKAGSETRINERRPRSPRRGGPIDRDTGERVYEETGRTKADRKSMTDPITGRKTYIDTGRTIRVQDKVDLLSVTKDAHRLIKPPGTVIEGYYADHSNRLKSMANDARREAVNITPPKTSPSAKKAYASEVQSLKSKLIIAERNAPLERQAQLLANQYVAQARQANPGMDTKDLSKIKQMALNRSRNRTGASKTKITVTQSEWDAIQAGAISPNVLGKVILNSDIDSIRRLALPKTSVLMSSTKIQRAKGMQESGATLSEIADALGVGLTTLKVALNE